MAYETLERSINRTIPSYVQKIGAVNFFKYAQIEAIIVANGAILDRRLVDENTSRHLYIELGFIRKQAKGILNVQSSAHSRGSPPRETKSARA